MALTIGEAVWEDSFPYKTEQVKISEKGSRLRVNVASGKQGKFWVCISPSLNVSSYGKTLKEAKEGFVENMTTFVEDVLELDFVSRDKMLRSMGWVKGKILKKQFSKAFVDSDGMLQGLESPQILSLDSVA